jgi:hypothetical protein
MLKSARTLAHNRVAIVDGRQSPLLGDGSERLRHAQGNVQIDDDTLKILRTVAGTASDRTLSRAFTRSGHVLLYPSA